MSRADDAARARQQPRPEKTRRWRFESQEGQDAFRAEMEALLTKPAGIRSVALEMPVDGPVLVCIRGNLTGEITALAAAKRHGGVEIDPPAWPR